MLLRFDIEEIFFLLGCYPSCITSYRRFGTIHRVDLQGSGIQEEGVTDRLPRNVGYWLPLYTAQHPRRAEISFTTRWKLYSCWLLTICRAQAECGLFVVVCLRCSYFILLPYLICRGMARVSSKCFWHSYRDAFIPLDWRELGWCLNANLVVQLCTSKLNTPFI